MKIKTIRKEAAVIALLAVFILPMLISSAHLVFATYTVTNPTYPFQPEDADIAAPWGSVGLSDLVTLALAYGSKPGDANWNPVADLNHDGKVNLQDQVILAKFYGQSVVYPVANVTSLEFDAPSNAIPDQHVYYYVITRVYVPSNPSNDAYFFVAKANQGSVQSIKIDDTTFSVSGSSINQSLGSLVRFHLVQFVFDKYAGSGGGSFTFSIATSKGVCASLYRFRVYVPNYSSSLYGYVISATTNFPGDWYWLSGYADKYVNNICIDVSHVWDSWEWSIGSQVSFNALNFNYPLCPSGNQISSVHTVNFTFWNSGAGLLDFQFISQSQQVLGPPDFYATANIYNLDSCVTLNSQSLDGGSAWMGTVGASLRNVTALATYNVGYNGSSIGLPTWFNASIGVTLGNWLATPTCSFSGVPPDVAISLNFTISNFVGNFWMSGGQYWFWFPQRYTLDFYSFPHLPMNSLLENGTGQSKGIISSSYSMLLNYGGTALLTLAGIATGGLAILGAGIGLGMTAVGMAIDYSNNQPVSQSNYQMTTKQDNHIQLTSNQYTPTLVITGNGTQSSYSDLIFLGLRPNSAWNCGLTEVNLQGMLEFGNLYSGYDWAYPIGNLNVTLCLPWFISQ